MVVGETIHSVTTNTTYTVIETLKGGGQAEVAFAISSKSDIVYFIKRLLNIKYSDKNKETCKEFEKYQQKLYHQIKINSMAFSSCPYIIEFFREKTFYYVVTERIIGVPCDTSELYKALTIQERIDLFKVITFSFHALEVSGIIHGDVKPENILLKRVNNHFVSKLIDLESAFFVSDPPEKGSIVGTDPYSSPEMIDYNDEDNEITGEVLSTKSDIFSLGVILHELMTGEYPKSNNVDEYAFEIVKASKQLSFPQNLSCQLKELIKSMLSINPNDRPTIDKVLHDLKELKDVSIQSDYCSIPHVVVERNASDIAYIHLISFTSPSKIRYRLDDGEEQEYVHPIAINDDGLPLTAFTIKKQLLDKDIISSSISCEVSVVAEYNGKVDRPYIDIETDTGLVTMSCYTDEVDIYYTTDGTVPTRKSIHYDGPVVLPPKTSIKAFARKKGMYNSDISFRNTSSILRMS